MTEVNVTATPDVSTPAIVRNFGEGRYSALQSELYKDLALLLPNDSDEELRYKLSARIVSDYGEAMKNVPVKATAGRTTSKNIITLKEACSVKTASTEALRVMHAINWINGAIANGIGRATTKWHLNANLQMFVDAMRAKL